MTLEGPRMLAKMIGKANIAYDETTPIPVSTVTGANWNRLNNRAFVCRTYYDLTGYNRDELTSFFQGTDMQEEFGPNGALQCWVIDLITTEFVDDDTITNAIFDDPTLLGDLPGFPGSTMNQEQVIYGRTRTFFTSTTWGAIGEFARTQWGTCTAATADKLHITRIVYTDANVVGAAGQSVDVPPVNVVSAIVVGKEKELAFLMRQKRSYELAT